MGDGAIDQAYKWIKKLKEAHSRMRIKEILIIDKTLKTVKPFDTRCVYEFLREIEQLCNIPEDEAVTMISEELLSPQLQLQLPLSLVTLETVRSYLVDRFGSIDEIVEKWLGDLDYNKSAAVTRHGGTRKLCILLYYKNIPKIYSIWFG